MTNLQVVFAIIAALMFVAPFFFWGIIRFWDKQNRKVVVWHKSAVTIGFGLGFLLFITFLFLAIFV